MSQPAKLALAIQYASERTLLPTRGDFRRWAKAALLHDVCAALRLVEEDEGKQLNMDYRGKPGATNVLTFAYGAAEENGPLNGDIILCVPVVEREAEEQRVSREAHYAHLTVHGMLHLQGYDHEADDEAVAMEALESFIMSRLGFPDPYKDG